MIPAAAIEAAHEQLDAMGTYVPRKYIEAALEAAAPHMLATAWDEGRDVAHEELARMYASQCEGDCDCNEPRTNPYRPEQWP